MNLTEYVKQVSLEDFGKPFCHEAFWNLRLRSTGGRFFPKDGHLDFNPKHLEQFGWEIFRKIVRHELCHYHLYFEQKGYRHRDQDFKELLQRVDGLRYAPSLNKQPPHLIYRCTTCDSSYLRRRRISMTRYCCGRCGGRLQLLE